MVHSDGLKATHYRDLNIPANVATYTFDSNHVQITHVLVRLPSF